MANVMSRSDCYSKNARVLKDVAAWSYFRQIDEGTVSWVGNLEDATVYGGTPPPATEFPFPPSAWDYLRWVSAVDGTPMPPENAALPPDYRRTLEIDGPPTASGPGLQAALVQPGAVLSLNRAWEGQRCRICGKSLVRTDSDLVLDYGREYAHQACLSSSDIYPREPETGEWYTDVRSMPSFVCVYVRRREVADEKLAQFPGTQRASLQGLVDRHNRLVKTMRDVAALAKV